MAVPGERLDSISSQRALIGGNTGNRYEARSWIQHYGII